MIGWECIYIKYKQTWKHMMLILGHKIVVSIAF